MAFAQLVHDMRRRGPIPLIVITDADDQVGPAGYLDAGADDCIARPVCRDDVVARIVTVRGAGDMLASRRGDPASQSWSGVLPMSRSSEWLVVWSTSQ